RGARGDRASRRRGGAAPDGRSRAERGRARRAALRGARRLTAPRFVPGLELARAYYEEVVSPVLGGRAHSAALSGGGSAARGFDTEQSADHGWAPGWTLFVAAAEVPAVRNAVERVLPDDFRRWPTRFGWDEVPVTHHVEVSELGSWLEGRIGFDPR